MQIEKKKISELNPAPYNPRKLSKSEYEKLKKSIEKFGYIEPIIWNKQTGNVVGGHQRLKILQEQGAMEVECVIVDFPEDEEKVLNLALNKISGEFDTDKLNDLFNKLKLKNIDLNLTGFHINEIEKIFDDKEKYFSEKQERSLELYNLYDFDETRTATFYQFPTLKACHYVPEELIRFNDIRTAKPSDYKKGVHFYIYDSVFERVWNRPAENIRLIKRFSCSLTPNFSLYVDMPMAMKIWNIYRTMLIGQMMQDEGMNVIPSVAWCDKETLDFCFDAIEPGGVVAIETHGFKNDKEAQKLWIMGTEAMIEKLHPEMILCYGTKPDFFDFGKQPVKFYKNSNMWYKKE